MWRGIKVEHVFSLAGWSRANEARRTLQAWGEITREEERKGELGPVSSLMAHRLFNMCCFKLSSCEWEKLCRDFPKHQRGERGIPFPLRVPEHKNTHSCSYLEIPNSPGCPEVIMLLSVPLCAPHHFSYWSSKFILKFYPRCHTLHCSGIELTGWQRKKEGWPYRHRYREAGMGWTVVTVGRCPCSLGTQLISFAHVNAGGVCLVHRWTRRRV